ncbi:MAG TPA: LacI family DNA-binding transcriptional regulator [Acidobacteriaceae bacterium]|nr:LacI family DNA-binding transcriptional regulator [Acidobacteriaceae bacterium]
MAKKEKRPTLSEVAAVAGVGTTTVSRVINGGQRVDPRTLARVQSAIDALGFMPNQAARILKGDRTRTIGLIIPSIADPFFAACAEAAQGVARAHGSLLIVTTTQNDPRAELESVNVLMSHSADGLILAPSNSESAGLRHALACAGVPVVAIDRPLSGSSIPSIVADNFVGANSATRHLIEHGYKRIACLTGELNLYTIQERISGYRQAVESAGLPFLMDTSITDYKSTERAVETLLAGPDRPDAFLTLKNSTTMYAFEALQKLHFTIPTSVALFGYDDFELAEAVRPSISVVQQPIAEIGRTAAELLFEELLRLHKDGRFVEPAYPKQVQLGTRLVLRSSCGCTPEAH